MEFILFYRKSQRHIHTHRKCPIRIKCRTMMRTHKRASVRTVEWGWKRREVWMNIRATTGSNNHSNKSVFAMYAYHSFIYLAIFFTRTFTPTTNTKHWKTSRTRFLCFFFCSSRKNYANGRKINSWTRASVIRGLLVRKYFNILLSVQKSKKIRLALFVHHANTHSHSRRYKRGYPSMIGSIEHRDVSVKMIS